MLAPDSNHDAISVTEQAGVKESTSIDRNFQQVDINRLIPLSIQQDKTHEEMMMKSINNRVITILNETTPTEHYLLMPTELLPYLKGPERVEMTEEERKKYYDKPKRCCCYE